MSFTLSTTAVGSSVGLTSLCAVMPLVAFFVFLMVFKWKAHWCALASALIALVVAIGLFDMPATLAGLSFTQGVAFGLFPIVYIIWMAVWIYDITVASGRFEDLRRIFNSLGKGDLRVQAMIIAFAFGGLLEALAGFGAPIAIISAMLVAIGVKPLRAVTVTVVANATPIAFGAMGIPVTTSALLTGLDAQALASTVGRQLGIVSLIIPFLLAFILDKRRGLAQLWPMCLVLGFSFGLGQFVASNYFSYVLTDVVACLLALAAGVGFLKIWTPSIPEEMHGHSVMGEGASNPITGRAAILALFPYLLIVGVFAFTSLWRIGIDVPALLAGTSVQVGWPGLHGHILDASGQVVSSTLFTFNFLSTPGTVLLGCGLVTALVYHLADTTEYEDLSFMDAIRIMGKGAYTMRYSALTIAAVMGLAYVMNLSGQTAAMGAFLAGAGTIFPLISPTLGWLGTWVTGSATSTNALFAQMQANTAHAISVDPHLLVAANSSGGGMAKMLSPQTLTIAATSVGAPGTENKIIHKVWGYSFGLLIFVCLLVYLQSTPVLGFMVVGLN
ncbi:L-lactate permease [Corynebacterium sp. ZY180755]